MSRRLIIIILAVLIVGVIGGTVVLVLSRLRSSQQGNPTTNQGNLQEAPTGGQNVVDPTGDDDSDGLSNADENLWGTNRTNADTDGDGFRDGEEVAADHNPTIPSPNDKLPPGFVPGREQNPLDAASRQPVAVDQFFVDGLNLDPIGNRNLSNEYRQQFGEGERNETTLRSFINEQPIVTQLPRPNEQSITSTNDTSAATLNQYLETAGNLEPLSNNYALIFAIEDLVQEGNTEGMLGLALTIKLHQQELLTLNVPPAATNLHRLLLGYTELLRATFEQVAKWNEDQVRAGVALRQLDTIDNTYLPLIQQEVNRLQAQAAQ